MIAVATTDEKTRTAHHEAAHAVVGEVLGCSIYQGSTVHNGEELGRVKFLYVPDDAAIPMLLAGPLSGLLLQGTGGDQFLSGAGGDLEKVDNLLEKRYGRKVERRQTKEYQAALTKARSLLTEFWPCVQHLAGWLLDNHEMSGPLVVATVENFERKRSGVVT